MGPTPQKTALVVASGGAIDELLTRVLAGEGVEVQRVADDREVISLVRANPFDLIVIATKIIDPDDVEFFRRIRSARPHIRLIISVEERTPLEVVDTLQDGEFSYFAAPSEASALAEIIRSALTAPYWDEGMEIHSLRPTSVRFAARGDLVTANRVVQFLHGFADIPPADKVPVVGAFREILINAVEYGAHFDPSQHMEISFIRSPRAISCRVKDPGQGFSLGELDHAAIGSAPGDLSSHVPVREAKGLRPGGFGMFLAKRMVDKLIYNKKGNDVILVKYFDQLTHTSPIASLDGREVVSRPKQAG